MMNMNKVILAGRVTKVESSKTKGDKDVATLTMVTSESFEKDGKREERAEWHRVVAWGRLAEYVGKYIKEGETVIVEGKLSTRKWDDKDGNKRFTTEVTAATIQAAPRGNGQGKSKEEKSDSSDSSNSGFSLED